MEKRTIEGFWMVWRECAEWPEQFYSEAMARDRANVLARSNPGRRVHLCKAQSVGTLMLPDKMETSGLAA